LALAGVARIAATQQPAQASPIQSAGIRGTICDAARGEPLVGVSVLVDGRLLDISRSDGSYRIERVAFGAHTIGVRRLGFRPKDFAVTVASGDVRTFDIVFDAQPVPIGLVTVVAASRRPQRLIDAPAAITIVSAERIADLAPLGQTPLLFADLPGVHVQQSGAFEFNLNTRGFNTTNARRMLVLVDGRDISVPLLGNQEWSDLSVLDDAARVEVVRGAGSALYGANAFNGVLAIYTPTVRDAQGLKLTATGGTPTTARSDVRYGALSASGTWGYRMTAGAMRGVSGDLSRTDSLALKREYANSAGGVPRAPSPGYEFVPLRGQSTGAPLGTSAAATGDINPTLGWYANARVDRYRNNGQVLTAEGGLSRTEHLISTISTGRSQTLQASRPWARVAWTDSSFTLFAYYNARTGDGSSMSVPIVTRDNSNTVHIEGQYDRAVAGSRGRMTLGASARQTTVQTYGSLLTAEGDGSATRYGAVFGQVEYALHPQLRAIVAARADFGSRDSRQFSPKLGLVWAPSATQSLRATFATGYLVAPVLARFLSVAAGPPLDFRLLEGGLRASPLGPALQGVPSGTLFTNSATVPLLALGNTNLRPERVQNVEVGYKAQLADWFVSATAFTSKLDGFLSPLLPGVNAQYPSWTSPSAVPDVARAALEGAVFGAVGGGLTRLANGSTAYVLSGGNAGRAQERGVEVEAQWRAGTHWLFDANYSRYDMSLSPETFLKGDTVLANAPTNSGNVSVAYTQRDGTRARVGLRLAESFNWRSALWVGWVPSMATVDAVVSRPLSPALSVSIVGTNLLDQARYQFFGGSLVRRRVMASLTWRQ